MPAIGVFIYEPSDRLLFLTVLPLLKAGTGIAELIALEMSKQVLISPSIYVFFIVFSEASVITFYFLHRQKLPWKKPARRFGLWIQR
jgi:hypothetical protein